jgi:hypothetical protein
MMTSDNSVPNDKQQEQKYARGNKKMDTDTHF